MQRTFFFSSAAIALSNSKIIRIIFRDETQVTFDMPSNEFRIFSAFFFLSPDILNNIFIITKLYPKDFRCIFCNKFAFIYNNFCHRLHLFRFNICELKITVFSFPSSFNTFYFLDNLLRIKTNCRFVKYKNFGSLIKAPCKSHSLTIALDKLAIFLFLTLSIFTISITCCI